MREKGFSNILIGVVIALVILGLGGSLFFSQREPAPAAPEEGEPSPDVSGQEPAPIEEPAPPPSPKTAEDKATPPPAPTTPSPGKLRATPKAINETGMPLALAGDFRISLFNQKSLGAIRFMAFSPDGILFVSMPSSDGLYCPFGCPNDGKVFALPDRDQDGKADEVKTVLSGLRLAHGLAFYQGYLYVAEEDKVSRYPYQNNGNLGAQEVLIENLPARGGHVSRTIGFSPSDRMYVSVGSSCNVCEEADERRAAILEFNPDGSASRVFATGLRNAVGFVFHPETGELWATENGRDELGDDLPPDEINIVRKGQDYGWPYCYGKKITDPAFSDPTRCATTQESLRDIQAHSAPLGLRFIESAHFPQEWQGDLLVAYHGSWNRSEPTGYKVVRLDVQGNAIVGETDFISGWLGQYGSVSGRPVDLIFGPDDGALYISDDKAGLIYRVTKL